MDQVAAPVAAVPVAAAVPAAAPAPAPAPAPANMIITTQDWETIGQLFMLEGETT